MRIAYLSTVNSYYGGEVCFYNLAQGMHKQGHDIFCAVKPDSTLREKLQGGGINVSPLVMVDWFDPLTIIRLSRWLRENRIEILHTHLPRDYYIAAIATLGTSICNVGTRHLLHPISLPLLKKPFLKRFRTMICVSEAVRQGVLSNQVIEPTKTITIHNGVNYDDVVAPSCSLRITAAVDQQTPVIGYVGRLSPGKGLKTLIKAAAILSQDIPELRVFILGDDTTDGAFKDELQRLVTSYGLANQITFFGYVNNAAAAAAEFDVQVVCSDAEPFGLVTIEAMANGCPVIATRTGGSAEILSDGQEGFLVNPGDTNTIVERINSLLTNQQLRSTMGARGRLKVRESFTIERMIDLTEKLYHSLL